MDHFVQYAPLTCGPLYVILWRIKVSLPTAGVHVGLSVGASVFLSVVHKLCLTPHYVNLLSFNNHLGPFQRAMTTNWHYSSISLLGHQFRPGCCILACSYFCSCRNVDLINIALLELLLLVMESQVLEFLFVFEKPNPPGPKTTPDYGFVWSVDRLTDERTDGRTDEWMDQLVGLFR